MMDVLGCVDVMIVRRRRGDLTFAQLFAQGELVSLHQDLLQAVQQSGPETLQQLENAGHIWSKQEAAAFIHASKKYLSRHLAADVYLT